MARRPRKISAVYLSRVTAHYLERYASSRKNLERLLDKRVYRAVEEHAQDIEEARALVQDELDRLERLNLLSDARYAADRARSLHRRGMGSRRIRQTLRSKGVSSDDIDAALVALGEDADLAAAATYARKRRLGPWRAGEADRERAQKELNRMGRAGFPFPLARRVVDAADPDELT